MEGEFAQVGAQISVRYLRQGKSLTTTVKLTPAVEKKDDKDIKNKPMNDSAKALSNLLGVNFKALDDVDRRRQGIPNSVRGVIVQDIQRSSDAVGKLRIGSVVTEVNFQPVSSPEQAIAAAEAAARANKPVLLQVWGPGEMSFVSVRTK